MAKQKNKNIQLTAEMLKHQSITEYFHEDYRDYAVHTILERAIPSFVDGMKPVQRKVFAATAKEASKRLIRIEALSGVMLHQFEYKHGPTSAQGAAIIMAQRFNQPLPYLTDDGQYGYVYDKAAGAPRYLDTRLSKWANLIMNHDTDLLNFHYENGKKLEPITYLPILPMMLINGTDGIAVGFATSYVNRNPLEIALATRVALQKGKLPKGLKITPYVHGHHGVWSWFRGKFEHVGTYERPEPHRLMLTGLPVSWEIAKYRSFLHEMKMQGMINDYFDYSNDDQIHIDVIMNPEVLDIAIANNTILRDFALIHRFPNDNLTCIMPDNKWCKFDDATDFIEEFVRFRLGVYTHRKANIIKDLNDKINWNNDIINFIDLIYTGVVDFRTQKEADIRRILKAHNINDKVLDIKVSALSIDNRHKHVDIVSKLQKELDKTHKTTEKQMYLKDLDVLIEEIEKDYVIEDCLNVMNESFIRIAGITKIES